MGANVIKESLAAVMKEAGFRRKGSNWFLDTEDAVLVVNLQKSNFGDQYYVNLAIWLRALGDTSTPKEQHCHIRIRAVALDPERQQYWEREVFNLEHPLSDAEVSVRRIASVQTGLGGCRGEGWGHRHLRSGRSG